MNEPEWIEHDGSAVCPVPAGHDVEIIFGDGQIERDKRPESWGWGWFGETHPYGRTLVAKYRDWTAWEQSKMSKTDDVPNPPAFPVHGGTEGDDPRNRILTGGMTLRDWFAGQALAGFMGNPNLNTGAVMSIAHDCYQLADAMLRARCVTPETGRGEG